MLNNSTFRPNRNLFFCGILSLISILTITYIPGFASYVNDYRQPTLVTMELWNKEIKTTSASIFFGWHKAYYLQLNEHEELKSAIDEDLRNAGLIYIVLSSTSLLLFGLSMLGMTCKR